MTANSNDPTYGASPFVEYLHNSDTIMSMLKCIGFNVHLRWCRKILNNVYAVLILLKIHII